MLWFGNAAGLGRLLPGLMLTLMTLILMHAAGARAEHVISSKVEAVEGSLFPVVTVQLLIVWEDKEPPDYSDREDEPQWIVRIAEGQAAPIPAKIMREEQEGEHTLLTLRYVTTTTQPGVTPVRFLLNIDGLHNLDGEVHSIDTKRADPPRRAKNPAPVWAGWPVSDRIFLVLVPEKRRGASGEPCIPTTKQLPPGTRLDLFGVWPVKGHASVKTLSADCELGPRGHTAFRSARAGVLSDRPAAVVAVIGALRAWKGKADSAPMQLDVDHDGTQEYFWRCDDEEAVVVSLTSQPRGKGRVIWREEAPVRAKGKLPACTPADVRGL